MRKLYIMLLILAGFSASLAMAAEAQVEIISPVEGAKLDGMEQNKIVYNVTRGPGGDHVHIYIDGTEKALMREMKGSYTMEMLFPGDHELCIKIVNKNHTPIGVEKCVNVTVE